MKTTQIIGIALLIGGVVVAYMGYSESQGIASSLSSAINGTPSDNVMIKYGVGAVLMVIGVILLKR